MSAESKSITFQVGGRGLRLRATLPSTDAGRVLSMMETGVYYGYPLCCVEEFVGFYLGIRGFLQATDRGARKHQGTGFVPCATCSETKSMECLSGEVSSNRLCPTDFPRAVERVDPYKETLSARGIMLRTYSNSAPRRKSQVDSLYRMLINNPTIPCPAKSTHQLRSKKEPNVHESTQRQATATSTDGRD